MAALVLVRVRAIRATAQRYFPAPPGGIRTPPPKPHRHHPHPSPIRPRRTIFLRRTAPCPGRTRPPLQSPEPVRSPTNRRPRQPLQPLLARDTPHGLSPPRPTARPDDCSEPVLAQQAAGPTLQPSRPTSPAPPCLSFSLPASPTTAPSAPTQPPHTTPDPAPLRPRVAPHGLTPPRLHPAATPYPRARLFLAERRRIVNYELPLQG